MADFPDNLPTFTDLDGSKTLAQNNHANRHNKVHQELRAVAEKVGVDGSANPDSLDKRTADLRTDVDTLLIDPVTQAYVDAAIATAKADAKAELHPVGSIYTTVTPGNPNTLLGFGTWVAFGAGKVMVGVDGAQTEFDTIEETGGAKTHQHWMGIGWDASNFFGVRSGSGGPIYGERTLSSLNRLISPAGSNAVAAYREGQTEAVSSLQPYVVVYMWKRTA